MIACSVLALDIREKISCTDIELSFDFLPAGLHERPDELRRRLQHSIDAASERQADRIAIGYGLCGRGTIGIHARCTPLFFPRVQDCIALFLGSDSEYRRQFSRYPGTYYISAGWFREKVEPVSQAARGIRINASIPDDELRRLEEKYGAENAAAVARFYGSWTANYQRAAFIDTGVGDAEKYHRHVRAMAREFGWKHEKIPGDSSLIEKMILGDAESDEITVVLPGYVTHYDAVNSALSARPAAEFVAGGSADVKSRTFAFCEAPSSGKLRGRGLGIDAGGTCTDAVAYDFDSDEILHAGKALTTVWDFAEGISAALDAMKSGSLDNIALVALSTTLATNAIVEGQGQRVGLLLMPPPGIYRPDEFGHSPAAIIKGRMRIDGSQTEPVDRDEVITHARKMMDKYGVTAFAISGYGAASNPSHELAVREIIENETGCVVCCGHELSEMLNFKTRASTAVLNARIIPRLHSFLESAQRILLQRGINAPVMVVKGDGTLMSREVAHRYPVETILSGPAASVAGARHLTGFSDATVLDVGGTTTDIAVIEDGGVRVSDKGTKAGKWQTHVRAVDMRTVGIGGDSRILWEDGTLHIGPQRLAPLSWASTRDKRLMDALGYMEECIDDFRASSRGAEILIRTGHGKADACNDIERRILDLLAGGPMSLQETAEKTGRHHWSLLPIERLENSFIVQRCGLTPTDLLHYQKRIHLWDAEAAARAAGIYADICRLDADRLTRQVFDACVRKLSREVLIKNLGESLDGSDQPEDCELCAAIMERWLGDEEKNLSVHIRHSRPLVGLGAPAEFFLSEVAVRLGAELHIPRGAHVANAIGAITSNITISQTASIRPNMPDGFVVQGIPGAPVFPDIHTAHAHAERVMQKTVMEKARRNGAAGGNINIDTHDRIASASDGSELFLERTLTATLTSAPTGGCRTAD